MKVIVFIDGENLRHRVADILLQERIIESGFELKKFNIRALIEDAVPEAKDAQMRYFGAKVRIRGSTKFMRDKTLKIVQQKRPWNSYLGEQKIDYIETGNLQLKTEKRDGRGVEYLVEKGVDVGMAVDMTVEALKRRVDLAVCVSSDLDVLPAIKAVRKEGLKVLYLTNEQYLTSGIAVAADMTRTFTTRQVVENYVPIKKQIGRKHGK
ncbi:MAG TPA: NYN domain-containing protein [Candidatus Saccharimonadales bacterium]